MSRNAPLKLCLGTAMSLAAIVAVTPVQAENGNSPQGPIAKNWCGMPEDGDWRPTNTQLGNGCTILDISIETQCPDPGEISASFLRDSTADVTVSLRGCVVAEPGPGGNPVFCDLDIGIPVAKSAGVLMEDFDVYVGDMLRLSAFLIQGETRAKDLLAAHFYIEGFHEGPNNCMTVFERE